MNLPLILTISVTVNVLFIGLFLSNFRQWWNKASTQWYNKRLTELKKENKALELRNEELLLEKFSLDEPLPVDLKSRFTDAEIMQNEPLEIGAWEEK
jgi:hypothetical protein